MIASDDMLTHTTIAPVRAAAPHAAPLRHPSRWSHRLVVIALALAGCGVALYLSLYQWHILDNVFEPLFGDGSRRILRQSWIARALPVPDALLGAVAYAAEAILAAIGGSDRAHSAPWIVVAFGAVSASLAAVALFLLAAQPLWFHAWCTLCLASAALSLILAALAAPEVIAAVRSLRRSNDANRTS
jgi:uncharacterized membrane protein